MPLDYSKRALWGVDIFGFSGTEILGEEAASTAVTVYLTAQQDEKLPGPSVKFEFAFPAPLDRTLRQLEEEALASVAALMKRLAKETPASLQVAVRKYRKDKLLQERD